MKPTKDVVACVVDKGQFLPLALDLSKHFAKVCYWSPWERCMPKREDGCIGDGFLEIERVESPMENPSQYDLFVFPDVGFVAEQTYLAGHGIPVWGHHAAGTLETNRGLFLQALESVGMDVPPHVVVKGMANLRSMLKSAEDKYIKISNWRGDWETWHWRSWSEDEGTLNQYAYRLGPLGNQIKFFVFDAIDTDIEDGVDTYCIGGQFPKTVIHGMEHKDKFYLGAVQDLDAVAEDVRQANEKFGPLLGELGYRGFFSTEVRIAGDKSYFIDPTCRAPSPPSQLYQELWSNLGDIVWSGANGILVEPEAKSVFGVQVLVTCDRDKDEWLTIALEDEMRPYFKCGFACETGSRLVIPPHQLENMIGWLVASGDSIEDAIGLLKERADQLPCGLCCDLSAGAHLLEEMEEAKSEGITFPQKRIPEPAIVLEST